jgi:ketosteroid isomerase-like protein
MSSDNAKLVREIYAAFAAGDAGKVLAAFSPTIV